MTPLRAATVADRAYLEAAHAAYRAELAAFAPAEFPPRPLEDAWLARPGELFPFVVEHAGRAAGFVLVLGPKYLEAMGESTAEAPADRGVHALWIEPDARGAGVGVAAAREVFEEHPGRWTFVVLRDNAPALAFWRRAAEPHAPLVVEDAQPPYVRFRFTVE